MERHMARADTATRGAVAASTTKLADILTELLSDEGIHAALRCLNARTRFRFTGLYHAEPPLLRNVHLFDRENPTLHISGAVCLIDGTPCSIVCATRAPFGTGDALRDPRLGQHAMRDTVLSYAGVPIRMADGRVWGTLCHFDVRPRLLPPAELPVLEALTPVFAAWVMARG